MRAGDEEQPDETEIRWEGQYVELRLAMIEHKHATVVRLRDEDRIDDSVLREIQGNLDVEEVHMSRRRPRFPAEDD